MEEPLMPSGLSRPVSAQPTPVDHLQKIVDLLQAAILAGDSNQAKQIAERLATEKVKLSIQLNKEEHEQRLAENSISVKVHVEDRETSGCPINLRVKPSDTIGDLKRRMCFEYEFPVEVQRWIIGKRIPKDNETLHRCGVRGSTHVHTLYLYLTTARSVGLDPNLIDTGIRGAVGGEISGDYMTMGAFREARNQPGQRSGRTPSRQSSNLSNVSNTTLSPVSEASNPGSFNTSSTLHASGSTPVLGQTQGKPQGQGLGRGQRQSAPDLSDTVFVSGPPVVSGELQAGAQAINTPGQTADDDIGWECTRCTFINKPTRPGCEVCGGDRPPDYEVPIGYVMSKEELCWLAEDEDQKRMLQEAEQRTQRQQSETSAQNFTALLATDSHELVENTEEFDCPICFDTVPPGEGVVLRECLHTFCQDCLMNAVRTTEEASLICPYQDDDYTCQAMLQDREVRALVSDEIYAKYLQRSLDTAESQASNSYHCKTPDCHGWCIYEDLVNFYKCPVCTKENCLTCKAIHEGMNCQQYQNDLKIRAANDTAALQTQTMLQKLVSEGEAMPCPQCKVIVQKKDGCDWIKCSICKTEICWVTKGPRWGPRGEGDISGGCGCRVNGAKCDPKCNNCH